MTALSYLPVFYASPFQFEEDSEDAANGTRAKLSLDFLGTLGPLCPRLTRGLNARYLALEVRGLKQRAEAEARSQVSKIGSAGGSQ
jgi:hypothetical protein